MFGLGDSVTFLQDGGEAEVPPLTLVISPDLRSTPTIDQGRGFGNGFGLGPMLTDGNGFFSSEEATLVTVELEPGLHGSVVEVLLIAEDKLVVLGFTSGRFSLFEFEDLPRFEENFVALRPTMDPPIFCVFSISVLEDCTLVTDELQSLVSKCKHLE